jgi:hypothetical protein
MNTNTNTNTGGDVCDSLASALPGGRGWPQKPAPSSIDETAAGAVRSEADDERMSFHESSHAVLGRWLTGVAIGGVTIVTSSDFGGLCWGPNYVRRTKFSDNDVPELCSKIGPLMPGPGESRADVADIYLHCFNRGVELVAGTEGERLFLDGEPWFAADDERQALAYASLITSSPASAAAFVAFCRVEAGSLLRQSEHIVHALASAIRTARTLNGEQVDQVISEAVTAKTVAVKRQRRDDWRRVIENAALFASPTTRFSLPVCAINFGSGQG